MKCPRRGEFGSPVFNLPNEDTWENRGKGFEQCSYCGSMHPDAFMLRVAAGDAVTPTDKNYKAYINDSNKFYYLHLSKEQRLKFIDLHNDKTLKLEYPGYFYVNPFFMRNIE